MRIFLALLIFGLTCAPAFGLCSKFDNDHSAEYVEALYKIRFPDRIILTPDEFHGLFLSQEELLAVIKGEILINEQRKNTAKLKGRIPAKKYDPDLYSEFLKEARDTASEIYGI
jgi:hypothetical protein